MNNSAHYRVRCVGCSEYIEEDGYVLHCPSCQASAFITSEYESKDFDVDLNETGLYRYSKWLPIRRKLLAPGTMATFQSDWLCGLTKLNNLWITFNGYWPERGADLPTSSFKDLEAYSVLGRIPNDPEKILTLASAGNTALAFVRACSINHVPAAMVVPESVLPTMYTSVSKASCVKLISIRGGDYTDAIKAADWISKLPGFFPEGGARNIARRDGLATSFLNAVETIGKTPDLYVQAIGSGAGAIASFEAACRISSGSPTSLKLHLSQNLPFAPIYEIWKTRSKTWDLAPDDLVRSQIALTYAQVLTNRSPPYSLKGGLHDCLTRTNGFVDAVTNEEILSAMSLFSQNEEIDLDPAAGVALASLLKFSRMQQPSSDITILLNITGGGRARYSEEFSVFPLLPDLSIQTSDIGDPALALRFVDLFH